MTLHRLSQAIALALAALTAWVFVSAAGVTPASEFALMLYGVAGVVAGLLFGVVFLILRVGTAGSAVYWRGDPRPRQLRGIAVMIVTAIAAALATGAVLNGFALLDSVWSNAASLVVWTVIPAIFLSFRWVRWPQRMRSASAAAFLLTGVPAICVAAIISFNSFRQAGVELITPPAALAFVMLAGLIVAAGAEEVICRVLLLTALLDLRASRFQAVFLSSVVFATIHAPLALALPAVSGDWTLLVGAAQIYAPVYLIQLFMGLVLGIVWLRTGSISLVTAIHALVNLGPLLAFGLAM